jgi:Fe-S-cluster containining protein
MKRFLSRLTVNPPRGLDSMAVAADLEMWQKTDCLSCANCCKTMSPTYNKQDLIRIAAHIGMTVDEFKKKYLRKDRDGDWINRQQPCQFLNLEDNKCSIYAVRPRDCAGFPHHTKKRVVDYMHVFKQNIEYCPATYTVVKMLREKIEGKSV